MKYYNAHEGRKPTGRVHEERGRKNWIFGQRNLILKIGQSWVNNKSYIVVVDVVVDPKT